jgi:hypothetical protein
MVRCRECINPFGGPRKCHNVNDPAKTRDALREDLICIPVWDLAQLPGRSI